MNKLCKKCNITKNEIDFGKSKTSKDSLSSYCKTCNCKNSLANYYKNHSNNKKRQRDLQNQRYASDQKTRDGKIAYRKNKYLNDEDYRTRCISSVTARQKERCADPNDPLRMWRSARGRINIALRELLSGKAKGLRSVTLIGCTAVELKSHLESLFMPNMNWDNYGSHWHIDHIMPISSAKDLESIIKLCNYTNLQPLWAKDNLSKGCKYAKA